MALRMCREEYRLVEEQKFDEHGRPYPQLQGYNCKVLTQFVRTGKDNKLWEHVRHDCYQETCEDSIKCKYRPSPVPYARSWMMPWGKK